MRPLAPRRTAPTSVSGLAAGALGLVLGLGPARAERFDLAGEARLNGSFSTANSMLLGTPDGSGPCGTQDVVDGSVDVSGTLVAALYGRSHRYQLAASLGYYSAVCTPFLRRPVGGFDLRGEHALSDRTRLTATGRAVFDRFDRANDARSGNSSALTDPAADPTMPTTPVDNRGQAAGTGFVQATLSVELLHTLSKRYGLRAGFSLRLLEVLDSITRLPEFSTLGPMESAEFLVAAGRDLSRDRFELPLRYRVSHFYPATLQEILPKDPQLLPGLARQPGEVPPAHDLYLAGAWEHRFDPSFTLRIEAGPAVMIQPHLCLRLDAEQIPEGRCSIDARTTGVRGYDAPPRLEASLGPLAGLTLAGEASLSYTRPRARYEVRLTRGYEPDPYAGALALNDRLAFDYQWRPIWEVALYGSAQILHSAQTSLGRVSEPVDRGLRMTQVVSPQNRTLYMAMGNLGVDWQLHRFVALFLESNFQLLWIRGERVPVDPAMAGGTEVPLFPAAPAPPRMGAEPMAPPDPKEALVNPGYQQTLRLTVLFGVRVFFRTFPTPRREADVLYQARSLP